ncbi:MAG TPA: cation diffusion facilitator family transporter [Candidatus Eremiobacteraceae bacterium]|nr:cation diffusion facilitator family transporter [Candidatus Eremiobacteraceae bacterium]
MATPPAKPNPTTRAEVIAQAGDARLRALRLPFTTNALLVIAKLAVWLVSGSVSVLSEAVHSAADLFMTIVQFFSIRAAARPADHDHAYGHGKYENISAALQAVFILAIATLIVVEAVARLRSGASVQHLDLGIAVMLASGVLNIFVSSRVAAAAERERSPALAAQAAELRADVWTAGGVAIILLTIKLTGLTILDPIFSLVVAGVIAHSAYDLTVRAFVELTDQRLPPQDEARVREIIERHKDIFVSYHKLRTRRSGGGEFIDFHLQMPGGTPLRQAHDLSDTIVLDIKQQMPLAHVLIHLEPAD